jgi:hypothetical protein
VDCPGAAIAELCDSGTFTDSGFELGKCTLVTGLIEFVLPECCSRGSMAAGVDDRKVPLKGVALRGVEDEAL